MPDPHFNAFRIKRQAHVVSRKEDSWNPFKLTFVNKNRPGSWSGNARDLESGPSRSMLDDETTTPRAHASTAPNPFRCHGDQERRTVPFCSRGGNVDTSQDSGETGETIVTEARSHTTGTETQSGTRLRPIKSNDGDAAADVAQEEEQAEKPNKDAEGWFKTVKPKQPFTVANQMQRTILNSWINVLIIAAPVGIAMHFVPAVPRVAVFAVNFIAIVPLAAMLSFATEEIALRTGETLGGLINASFGNAVELIVAIEALAKDQITIVQTSLIGSILSNLLLVMGMCFFFGGWNRREQFFNTTVAQTAASLLALAVASVIVPTVFDSATNVNVAPLSRGVSVILLFVYAAYLTFQLKTHSDVFNEESQKVPTKPFRSRLPECAIGQGLVGPAAMMSAQGFSQREDNELISRHLRTPPPKDDQDQGGEDPQLHLLVALSALTISTVIIAICAEFMVDGISAVTDGGKLTEEFVGLILLPIVGNAAEHATAVTVAIKDKMDLAIGVAVGSSMQVALFIIPLLVVIGWGMGKDTMNLSFDTFQVAVLFVAVLLVNYLIGDGKSHWLEGMLLMCLYVIIAVCSAYYPDENNSASNGTSPNLMAL